MSRDGPASGQNTLHTYIDIFCLNIFFLKEYIHINKYLLAYTMFYLRAPWLYLNGDSYYVLHAIWIQDTIFHRFVVSVRGIQNERSRRRSKRNEPESGMYKPVTISLHVWQRVVPKRAARRSRVQATWLKANRSMRQSCNAVALHTVKTSLPSVTPVLVP